MKKIILSILLLFTGILLFAQNQDLPPVTAEKISDNLYQLNGGRGANSGMYIGDNEVILIDSKMDKAAVDGIMEVVKTLTVKPVTLLINTHSDGDHVNGNQFVPESVIVVSHENCRKEFLHPGRDGTPSMWLAEELQFALPEITFSDKMQLHSGSKTVELYYFGVGHTTGDIVVYFPEEKTAFIGDQVFFERPQLIHSYKDGNSFEHVKTTQKLLAALPEADKFCSGHSTIKNRTDIEKHLAEFTAFQQKVKSLMSEGKTLKETQSAFAENEANLVESVYNELKAM